MLVVFDIFLEIIDLLEAATDHVLLRLERIESVSVDAQHFCEIFHLILVKTTGLTTGSLPMDLLVALHELRDALFAQRLVKIATTKYIESKTKMKSINVALLQRRADSLASLLNDKTFRAASSQQVLVDVNPGLKTAPITAEISTREKSMIATIFAEVVKNLEIAKSILSQETPAIQLVDQSSFPLEKVRASKIKAVFVWGILFIIIYVGYLLTSKWIKLQLRDN